MSLAKAIVELEAELETSINAKEGTPLWFKRRGLALGLSFMRKALQAKLDDPGGYDRYYKLILKQLKLDDATVEAAKE